MLQCEEIAFFYLDIILLLTITDNYIILDVHMIIYSKNV